jgi:hypothetical protein
MEVILATASRSVADIMFDFDFYLQIWKGGWSIVSYPDDGVRFEPLWSLRNTPHHGVAVVSIPLVANMQLAQGS